MSRYILEILPLNDEVKKYYLNRANFIDDAGVDIFIPINTIVKPKVNGSQMIGMSIKCRMIDHETGNTVSYYLYPRSSLSKTPLILANHVGIIDRNYRGEIIGAFKNLDPAIDGYNVSRGDRLLQICAPDLSPLEIKLVESLDSTERGEGGFGSTGK